MLTLFGPAEGFQGLALRDLFQHPEQWRDYLDRIASKGAVATMETAMRRLDGTVIWCQVSASAQIGPDGQVTWIDGVIEDVSEGKRLQDQLRHSQKMEAIGTLAGGIAHDFNNLLTAIIGYGTLARDLGAPGSQARDCAQKILAAAEQAAELTHDLLAMSRKEAVNLQPVDLNAIVEKIEQLMTRIMGADIEFRTSYAEGELMVLGDSSQLEQVLMNLVANARDAMPKGGRLTIATSVAEVAAGETFLSIDPGKYARVSVSDTGQGMDEATRQRIFEPFFTTKEAGKGTGLGLSIAYGTIKQHNGEISVSSEPGVGTTFKVYLKCLAAGEKLGSCPGAHPTILREPMECTIDVAGAEVRGSDRH
jgi:signal transduction histidine kinase